MKNRSVHPSPPPEGDLWATIGVLVNEAARVEETANQIVETILKRSDPSATFQIVEKLYELVCWKFEPGGDVNRTKNEDFWQCLSIAISDQFRGFKVRDKDSDRQSLLKFFRKTAQGIERESRFWNLVGDNPARPWFLLAYNNTLGDVSDPPAVSPTQLETFVREGLNKCDPSSLLFIRLCAIDRLARNAINPVIKAKDPIKSDDDLFALLERLLTRGSDDATAIQVSLLMRTLGGRYLKGRTYCAPKWRVSFSEGVKYVLRKQLTDGGWILETGFTDSPVLHRYSPLLQLLDLKLDVLRPHIQILAKATTRSLSAVGRDLELAKGISLDRAEEKEIEQLFESVFAGLSLGAIAYDRFKDLLSDSILDSLGAKEGRKDRAWIEVPSSLDFRTTLEEGVITEWVKESRLRPGTILMYGPPGTGKTTIASLIAEKLNVDQKVQGGDVRWRFVQLTPADFARDGSDGIVACAEKIFAQLMRVRRCVVLLDEMEEFLRTRGPGSDKVGRLITAAFLPLLQEAGSSREIILVVATNYVGTIDSAVTRRGRFDLILPLGPPDDPSRRTILGGLDSYKQAAKIFEPQLGLRRASVTPTKLLDLVVKYTMGYTQPEIEEFCRVLLRLAEYANTHRADREASILNSENLLEMKLWELRADRVPTALSGRIGCNWRVFADEARRYARPPISDATDYWQEPDLPKWPRRTLKSSAK